MKKAIRIVGSLITLFVLVAFVLGIVDFFAISNGREPRFCIQKGTAKYENGDVEWCNGFWYHTAIDNREHAPIKAEFKPFFMSLEIDFEK